MYHYVWDIEQNMQCGIIHANVNFQQHGKLSSAEIADAYIMLFRIAPLSLWTILNNYASEQFWTLCFSTILNITFLNNSEHYASKQFWTITFLNNSEQYISEHYISEQFMCKRHEIGRLGRNLTLMILKVKGMQSLWTAFDL